jgi:hypothetical protein
MSGPIVIDPNTMLGFPLPSLANLMRSFRPEKSGQSYELDSIYDLLNANKPSHIKHKVDIIDCVYPKFLSDTGDVAYVDDEGLLFQPRGFIAFKDGDDVRITAGPALIMGTDENGESVDPVVTLAEVASNIVIAADFFEIKPFFNFEENNLNFAISKSDDLVINDWNDNGVDFHRPEMRSKKILYKN